MTHDQVKLFQKYAQQFQCDCTYKCNKFDYPAMFFVGIDGYMKSRLLAFALVDHETKESYEWVFTQLKTSVGDTAWNNVDVVLTDGDQIYDSLIGSMLPQAAHLRCIYHLYQNVHKHCMGALKERYQEFISLFSAWVFSDTEHNMNKSWETLYEYIQECGDGVLKYIDTNIKPIEHKFVAYYTRNRTTLGCQSTQRTESQNNVVKQMSDAQISLAEFLSLVCHTISQQDCESLSLRDRQLASQSKKDSSLRKQLKRKFTIQAVDLIMKVPLSHLHQDKIM